MCVCANPCIESACATEQFLDIFDPLTRLHTSVLQCPQDPYIRHLTLGLVFISQLTFAPTHFMRYELLYTVAAKGFSGNL